MSNSTDSKTSIKEVVRSMNYNVKLVFAFFVTNSLGRGIWMGNVLSTYIFIFTENAGGFWGLSANEILGLTSAATGITMTIFVFPSGYLADRIRRDIILKSSTLVGVAAMAFLIFGNSIIYILISLLLWGLFNAMVQPALQALFADSISSGYRSRIYSWGHLVNQFAMALGPFINIILFVIFGNNWNISILKSVMIVGLIISLVSAVILLFFKDDKSLGKESEAITSEVVKANEEIKVIPLTIKMKSDKAAKFIPILLMSSSVIIGIGAGMTVKFFPIFFMVQYTLSPIWLQVVMGVVALLTGIMAIVAQKASLKLGRVQTIFIVQFIATACLVFIAIYPPLGFLLPLFFIRGSFMNAAQPLSQSILMDVISKKNRAKWNSLQSIAQGLFWNASAALGGFLVGDNNTFNLCFIITAFVYIIGQIPMILLLPLVAEEREAKKSLIPLEEETISPESEIANKDRIDPTLNIMTPETKEMEIQ